MEHKLIVYGTNARHSHASSHFFLQQDETAKRFYLLILPVLLMVNAVQRRRLNLNLRLGRDDQFSFLNFHPGKVMSKAGCRTWNRKVTCGQQVDQNYFKIQLSLCRGGYE